MKNVIQHQCQLTTTHQFIDRKKIVYGDHEERFHNISRPGKYNLDTDVRNSYTLNMHSVNATVA